MPASPQLGGGLHEGKPQAGLGRRLWLARVRPSKGGQRPSRAAGGRQAGRPGPYSKVGRWEAASSTWVGFACLGQPARPEAQRGKITRRPTQQQSLPCCLLISPLSLPPSLPCPYLTSPLHQPAPFLPATAPGPGPTPPHTTCRGPLGREGPTAADDSRLAAAVSPTSESLADASILCCWMSASMRPFCTSPSAFSFSISCGGQRRREGTMPRGASASQHLLIRPSVSRLAAEGKGRMEGREGAEPGTHTHPGGEGVLQEIQEEGTHEGM